MNCPKCGGKLRVARIVHTPRATERTRMCPDCKRTYSTAEISEEDFKKLSVLMAQAGVSLPPLLTPDDEETTEDYLARATREYEEQQE